FVDPVRAERFHFTRTWAQQQAERISKLNSRDFQTARWLNLPPHYLLIHRVTLGVTGILCQLDATVPALEHVVRWQPGFANDHSPRPGRSMGRPRSCWCRTACNGCPRSWRLLGPDGSPVWSPVSPSPPHFLRYLQFTPDAGTARGRRGDLLPQTENHHALR